MPPTNIFQPRGPRIPNSPTHFVLAQVQQAMALHQAGKLDDAAAIYARVLALDPGQFECVHYLGVAKMQRGHSEEALVLFDRALRIRASDASLHSNKGLALQNLGRMQEALASAERALALDPRLPEALSVRGWALRTLGRLQESLESLDKALAGRPKFAEVHRRRAVVLSALSRFDEARLAFERALELEPNDADAQGNLGTLLTLMGRGAEARAALERAIALAPDSVTLKLKHAIAWIPLVRSETDDIGLSRASFGSEIRALLDHARAVDVPRPEQVVGAAQPFYLAYQETNNEPLLSLYGDLCVELMRQWQARRTPADGVAPAREAVSTDSAKASAKTRVGIVSSHIYAHSVWWAIVRGWVAELDRDQFEIHVFHLSSACDSETEFARARAQSFVAGERSLDEWVGEILQARMDVLLYPELGMDALTPKLASLRLAPVQAASWGHPETTGLSTIDHYLSAERFEDDRSAANYREALVTLPGLGCCIAPESVRPAEEAATLSLGELGVAAGSTLFICGGTPFKYTPEHDGALARIARAVPSAQFLFFQTKLAGPLSVKLMERLARSFTQAGLDPARHLVLAPWLERGRFLGAMALADVFLDTAGFSGFNTVMQAVESGLPVATRRGDFMRGRFGSAILEHLGLQDLVAEGEEAWVSLAVRLATDAALASDVRARMAATRGRLYEDKAPIRALERHLLQWTSRTGAG
jgi:protein O-GlcNAc transferase